ncbi:MAG: hypothetical protein M1491_04910 [Deltaproteobacteria bacterium]|nr:hypothetical protein [Deltaproteobacteria bacterium]MCL5277146.1 hypothetical protein [Deltaproteobacteria bacterium]
MRKGTLLTAVLVSLSLLSVKGTLADNGKRKSLLSDDRFTSYYNENKVGDIDASLSELNRQMLAMKGRLLLFGEGIVYSLSQGAPVQITLDTSFPHNDLVPEKVSVYVDGFKLSVPHTGSLSNAKDVLFNGALVPGKHNIEVYMLLKTSGLFGIGTGKDYNFTASGVLDARPDMMTHLDLVCIDTGKGDIPERPNIKFEQSFRAPSGVK